MPSRRVFLAAACGGAIAAHSGLVARAANRASRKVVVAVMGVNGRGTDLAKGFSEREDTSVKCICDVDSRAVAKCQTALAEKGIAPAPIEDFRTLLDDSDIDVIVVATPNHWHAPAAILAAQAGKHVYLEKPCCQNPHEGDLLVQAASKYQRLIQHGTQRRSWPAMQEAMGRLHSGEIGKVLFARTWYNNHRGSIGRGRVIPAPTELNYSLWQGPAPDRPYQDNVVHYNWHWFWHWGNGELGNNGVHGVDLCLWGLQERYPVRAISSGGRWRFNDDQETPDTQTVSWEFADGKGLTWEGNSWNPHGNGSGMFGSAFYGENGTMVFGDDQIVTYDVENRETSRLPVDNAGDAVHLENFLNAIRDSSALPVTIEEAYAAALACHLGNISQRTSAAISTDPATGKIVNSPQAEKLWKREYTPQWEPKLT